MEPSVVPVIWWVAPIASLLALIFAVYFYKKMIEASEGSAGMIEIAGHVREGAMAYLKRQYKVVALVFLVLFVVLQLLAFFGIEKLPTMWAITSGTSPEWGGPLRILLRIDPRHRSARCGGRCAPCHEWVRQFR